MSIRLVKQADIDANPTLKKMGVSVNQHYNFPDVTNVPLDIDLGNIPFTEKTADLPIEPTLFLHQIKNDKDEKVVSKETHKNAESKIKSAPKKQSKNRK